MEEKMVFDPTEDAEKKQHDTVKIDQKASMQFAVFQQYFTFEQIELQKTWGQDQLANQKGPSCHVSKSEGIRARRHHGKNGIKACTGKVKTRAQEGSKQFAKKVCINQMLILIGAW
jgi:hypothetical protein